MLSKKPSVPELISRWNTKAASTSNGAQVENRAAHYRKYFNDEEGEEPAQTRKENSSDVSNTYYDLTTDFYEFGWGESIHFCTMRNDESREHSFAKYEYMLALKLGLKPSDLVLDAGCGIGGPARHIASFSGSRIIGINCNEHQLTRARVITRECELSHLCSFVKVINPNYAIERKTHSGDYHNLPYPDGTFDKAYALEATCHSPDLAKAYAEIGRVLKPGGLFACCEWIMTDYYNPTNHHHRKIKADILEGDGLPDLLTVPEVHDAVRKAGLEILEARDHALDSQVPWYTPLNDQWKFTPWGRTLLLLTFLGLEGVGVTPPGYSQIHRIMCKAIVGLSRGGEEGIFSPMYVMILRKPESQKQ